MAHNTAVLKSGAVYDEWAKQVTTKAGDKAIVIDTLRDGNCMIYSLVRGFFGGYPLSKVIERELMLLLRRILSQEMKTHQWGHTQVAAPQTIEEAIASTATEGEWCGEIALVSFATITGSGVRLWRYSNNDPSSATIEQSFAFNVGNGDPRLIVNILQTRSPLPDRPEHNSHYQSVVMLPIPPSSPTMVYGNVVDTKGDLKYYDYVEDATCSPPFRIAQQVIIKIKGGQQASGTERIVHRIARKANDTGLPSFHLMSLYKQSKGAIAYKYINDIIPHSSRIATADEIKHYNSLCNRVPSPSTPVVTPANTPPRVRTPVAPLQVGGTAAGAGGSTKKKAQPKKGSQRKLQLTPVGKRTRAVTTKDTSSDDSDDDDVKVITKKRVIATPKNKPMAQTIKPSNSTPKPQFIPPPPSVAIVSQPIPSSAHIDNVVSPSRSNNTSSSISPTNMSAMHMHMSSSFPQSLSSSSYSALRAMMHRHEMTAHIDAMQQEHMNYQHMIISLQHQVIALQKNK